MTLLEVEDLHTCFHTSRGRVDAVNEVSFNVEPGEIVGIVGESGSGKSVLAKSIMRLIDEPGEIRSGDIQFLDQSLLEKTEREMQSVRGGSISMVFQDPMNSMNPTITVGEQIAEAVRLHQDVGESVSFSAEMKRKILGTVKNSASWQRAIEMLEAVQIPEPENRASNYPHEFSGGMRQRAMIAMALSCEPDLLIADEPTTALDVTIQAQILDEIKRLRDEFDTAILLITHNLPVVAEVCDRVNVMYAGEIVEQAKTEDLMQNPQHPYTIGLLRSVPTLDRTDQVLTPIPGDVPELIDIPFACHFAPRCPEATEQCLSVEPEFVELSEDGHRAACLELESGKHEQKYGEQEVN